MPCPKGVTSYTWEAWAEKQTIYIDGDVVVEYIDVTTFNGAGFRLFIDDNLVWSGKADVRCWNGGCEVKPATYRASIGRSNATIRVEQEKADPAKGISTVFQLSIVFRSAAAVDVKTTPGLVPGIAPEVWIKTSVWRAREEPFVCIESWRTAPGMLFATVLNFSTKSVRFQFIVDSKKIEQTYYLMPMYRAEYGVSASGHVKLSLFNLETNRVDDSIEADVPSAPAPPAPPAPPEAPPKEVPKEKKEVETVDVLSIIVSASPIIFVASACIAEEIKKSKLAS